MGYRYPGSRETALRDVSIEIAPGERVLIAGPTGSGKSTLLRVLSGLVPHLLGGELTGSALVAGADTRTVAPHDLASRGVALVAQDPAETFVADRVAAEVAFGPESLGLAAADVDARVADALSAVELDVGERRRVRELSGGEQQRVAIASALAMRPSVLLMDEPTAHLDEPTARGILHLVARLARERGMTLVLAEHRLGIAAGLVSRALVIAEGRVILDGDARQVLGDPAVAALGVPVPRTVAVARALDLPPPVPLVPEELAPRLRALAGAVAGRPAVEARSEALRFDGVTFAYPGAATPAVRSISFTIGAGERVALVGPTGSGKSTIARLALGLRRPDAGEATLAGMSTRRTRTSRLVRSGGLVLQDPVRQLIGERVEDEIASGLGHLPAAERWARVEQEIARFGLAGLRGRHPLTLSEGERRRVVLAAATARHPAVLVLDEPTLGQDARQRDELARLVAELARSGTAVLVISHDPEFVNDACERALVLRQGALVADVAIGGEPETVRAMALAGIPLADVPATVLLLGGSGTPVAARTAGELIARVVAVEVMA